MPRIIRRQSSDPTMRPPSRVEHREYFDGPTNIIEETTEVIRPLRPPSRPPSHSLALAAATERLSGNRRHESESEESDYISQEDRVRRYRGDTHARGRSRSSRREVGRRRSRHSGREDEGEFKRIWCVLVTAV